MRFALLTILVLSLHSAVAQATLTIELKPEAALAADYVRLGDVGTVKAGENEEARLARLFLGPTPAEGQTRAITRDEIRARLQEAGFGANAQFTGAAEVRVMRAMARAAASLDATPPPAEPRQNAVAEAMIMRSVAQVFSRQFNRTDLEGEIHLLSLDRDLPAAVETLEMREIISGRLPGKADARFLAQDREGKALGHVTARIEAWVSASVVTLRRPLRPGEGLMAEDVVLSHVRLQPGTAYLPVRAESLAGCQAARSLRPMTPLLEGDLAVPAAVHKGELVAVDTRAGGFQVRSIARSLSSARAGERVIVENLETKKRFVALVTGPGTVAVGDAEGSGR